MPELPASVRVALWTSHAWAHGQDVAAAIRHALADVDVVLGLEDRLALWRELGERAVYAALPRPGARGLLPACDGAAFDAAAQAEESLFVAGFGGLAVPRQVLFGAERSGLALRWESFDADPVPVHRLAGVDVAAADADLRRAVHATLDGLGDGGWVDAWQRERPHRQEEQWGLPPGLPDRTRGLVVRAGTILAICDAGLEHAEGSVSADLRTSREVPLSGLRRVATSALETATCAGVSYLAAQSRTMRS